MGCTQSAATGGPPAAAGKASAPSEVASAPTEAAEAPAAAPPPAEAAAPPPPWAAAALTDAAVQEKYGAADQPPPIPKEREPASPRSTVFLEEDEPETPLTRPPIAPPPVPGLEGQFLACCTDVYDD